LKRAATIRKYFYLTLALTITDIILSCENKADSIANSDILNLPTLTVKKFSTVFADSGKIQMIMAAPLMESYENKEEPYSEFRMGFDIIYYDGKKDSVGRVTSKYALYTNKKKLWELRDSVVVINFDSNYKIETEELFWDQQKDIFFNDRFLKFSSDDQIVYGNGFESDSRLNKRKIRNVSGPIYLREE